MVCPYTLVRRFAGNRTHHVTGHPLELVPALLGFGEIRDNRLGRHHIVHVHTNPRATGCYGARLYVDDRRSKKWFPRSALGTGCAGLLVNTTLSVYKPRGMTKYGRRKQREQRAVGQRVNSELSVSSD